jgi:hypothetical protein
LRHLSLGRVELFVGLCRDNDRSCKASGLDFAETVWTGTATAHIRRAIEVGVTLDQLKRVWAIISQISFVELFAENRVQMMIVSGTRDQVVKFDQAKVLR